ncbi:MAG: hypothetical protein ACI96M_004817, partial [Candidatus Azotimanducaceae bacterium]
TLLKLIDYLIWINGLQGVEFTDDIKQVTI